jgi:hypothetical protein
MVVSGLSNISTPHLNGEGGGAHFRDGYVTLYSFASMNYSHSHNFRI